ncbi:MAG: aldehyde dehydrogenase family protein [Pyrinomonadaceae bacterium]
MKRVLIEGEWRETGEKFEVTAPFSGEVLDMVCSAAKTDAEDAIHAAEAAAAEMRQFTRENISKGLRRISAGIEEKSNEFAQTIALESGKPIAAARGEVGRAIATFALAASEAERFAGEMIPLDVQKGGEGKTGYTFRVPKGIIYGITPFNFPLNLVAHKVAPALAAGNSIIIKPSEKTPLTSLLLGEVFLKSGLPKSALQIVPMDVKYMDTILGDDRIKMISFTGSDKIGWMLKEKCGKKAIALELGGNAPVIVDESADIESTAAKTAVGAFVYSGQVCISVQRVLLHEKIADEFSDRFLSKVKDLKSGDPMDEDTVLSSMIDEDAAVRAKGWVDEAVGAGAKLRCGGGRNGAFLEPTVLTDVDPEMRIVSEEAFAPVAVIERFKTFPDAVAMANQSRYGLQVGVFTENTENIRIASRDLEYGGVIFNDSPTFRVDNMPYGGIKDSGFGREGVKYAMEEMSEIKLIVIDS